MPDKNDITIRYANGTYTARCQGKTASCTAGSFQAAQAVAKKVKGENSVWFVARGSGAEYGRELWKIV
jgi:phosphosulfolactate phosphohydrolase-like enzyme